MSVFRARLVILLLSLLFLTSCSMFGLLDTEQVTGFQKPTDNANNENNLESESLTDYTYEDDSSYENEIALEVLNIDYSDGIASDDNESISDGKDGRSASGSSDRGTVKKETDLHDQKSIKMEIKLYFADKEAVSSGKPGLYGFVTPTVRKVPATSGILRYTLNELIKGPLSQEDGLDPVLPATVKVNKVVIKDRVAIIDFNKALLTDHAGGTLGGSIMQQAIVFTASQFASVDGVMVTVEGKPWDDGHFIWDYPIYEEELLKSMKSN